MPLSFSGVTISGGMVLATPPGAPTIGTATTTSITSATITFTAPDNNGGSEITSYTAISTPGNIIGSVSQSGSGTITVTGLTINTNYTFVVYATNSAGNSSNSSASNQITTTPFVPDAPNIGAATTTGSTTATVSFIAPGNNGGATITSYTAVSSPGGITATLSQSGSGTITVTGLTPNTSYTFTVYATNSVGNSNPSSASNQITTTIAGVPTAPTIGTATAIATTTATVSYTESANQIKHSTNFPGVAGSYLSSAPSTALGLSSNFTIEFWFNTTAKTNSSPILVSNGNFGPDKWQINDRHQSWPNVLTVAIFNHNSGGGSIVGTTTIANGTWYHVALVRAASTFRLYLNGVQEGSTLTFSGAFDAGGAQTVYIGQDQSQGSLTAYNGRISNLRIVKGVSVYTGAFTTPESTLRATQSSGTNIAAITGTSTSLLTCQSSTTVDNSTNNLTMTLNGTASISNTAPVGDVTTYTAVSNPGGITGTLSRSGSGTITVTGLTVDTSYTFTVYATNNIGSGLSSSPSNSITIRAIGQQAYTTPGTYSWIAPAGVTSVCVVCVGAGAGGGAYGTQSGGGGGGGGLGWKNNITVVPGQSYTVVVGSRTFLNTTLNTVVAGSSYFIDTSTVAGNGGTSGTAGSGGPGGTYVGDGGGNGGKGGQNTGGGPNGSGGGGAGGYSGNGGAGATDSPTIANATAGSGGGGGGGGRSLQPPGTQGYGGDGGGVGILGEGANGAAGTTGTLATNGGAGSGGVTRTSGGGGGGWNSVGGQGAVRIIWGPGRAFPSTNTADQ